MAIVTLGNFDGVHIGHRKILTRVLDLSRLQSTRAVVFTFWPHPSVYFGRFSSQNLIMTRDERREVLLSLGIDEVFEEEFSEEFANLSAEGFLMNHVVKRFSPKVIIVGHDFGLGKGRSQGCDWLSNECKKYGVDVEVVPAFSHGGIVVSSTEIRKALYKGQVDIAKTFLGRPFSYRGEVVRGDGRGRKIGFETANVEFEEKLVLPNGVYATTMELDGESHVSVSNFGVRPTFDRQKVGEGRPKAVLETHVIGKRLDLYGRRIEVFFHHRLRDEKRFSGIEALKSQIQKDIRDTLATLLS